MINITKIDKNKNNNINKNNNRNIKKNIENNKIIGLLLEDLQNKRK